MYLGRLLGPSKIIFKIDIGCTKCTKYVAFTVKSKLKPTFTLLSVLNSITGCPVAHIVRQVRFLFDPQGPASNCMVMSLPSSLNHRWWLDFFLYTFIILGWKEGHRDINFISQKTNKFFLQSCLIYAIKKENQQIQPSFSVCPPILEVNAYGEGGLGHPKFVWCPVIVYHMIVVWHMRTGL